MGKVELHLTIDAELLEEARRRGVRLDEALADGLRKALGRAQRPTGFIEAAAKAATLSRAEEERRAREWAKENAEAIKAHRERIEEYGVFGDDLRTW